MTLSKERVEELEDIASSSDGEAVYVDAAELRVLIAAYRTREAAIAECEALNHIEFLLDEDDEWAETMDRHGEHQVAEQIRQGISARRAGLEVKGE